MVYALGLLVLLTTIGCERAARRGWLPYWVSRKVLHVVAVGACAVAAVTVDHGLLIPIVVLAEVLLIRLVLKGHIMRDETGRRAWGIVWFPLAFLILLAVAPPAYTTYGMAVLAVCDPLATVVGKLTNWRPYNLTGDKKTLGGSLAFGVGYILLSLCLSNLYADVKIGPILVMIALEALGSKGLDNLYVPLGAAWFSMQYSDVVGLENFMFVPALLFIVFTVGRRSLTLGGAVLAAVFAQLIVIQAGSIWLLPLLVFFGSSTLIGNYFPSGNEAGDAKHGRARDVGQVFCNGAVYVAVVLFFHQRENMFYLTYSWWRELLLVAAAVATADTWASEIGQYFRGRTFDILRGRPVPVGLSGGVSWAGSLGAVAGAGLIASLGFVLLGSWSWFEFLTVTAFGALGMLIDSLIGSTLQIKYKSVEYEGLLDAPLGKVTATRGVPWITNDIVNLLSIALTVVLTWLSWKL